MTHFYCASAYDILFMADTLEELHEEIERYEDEHRSNDRLQSYTVKEGYYQMVDQ